MPGAPPGGTPPGACGTGTMDAFGYWKTQSLYRGKPSKCRTAGGNSRFLIGVAVLRLRTPLIPPLGARRYSQSPFPMGSL